LASPRISVNGTTMNDVATLVTVGEWDRAHAAGTADAVATWVDREATCRKM